EYFSLYEEKNDGPAALIFGDGEVVGARLDRLGLRPLRSIETDEYLCAMSEAGQIDFPSEKVIARGRVESGGTLYYDHIRGRSFNTIETLEDLASRKDYAALLEQARVNLDDIPAPTVQEPVPSAELNVHQRMVAYSLNQESLKLLMDPMLQTGAEKVSAMGYGYAINSLADEEGGMAKYFSQRFAQVTNPPLDSIREADGMTLRVALGARPLFVSGKTTQIVIPSPVLTPKELAQLEAQASAPVKRFDMLFDHGSNVDSDALEGALAKLCDDVEATVREQGGIIIISDRGITKAKAALPLILTVAALNQRLIREGLRFRASIIVESGQVASSHHVATALGFGASAVMPLSVVARARDKFGSADEQEAAIKKYVKACEKALMKTMGKVGLCTAESYIGGEFFEPNFFDTNSGKLADFFPNMNSPVGGVGFETVVKSAFDWHAHALGISEEGDIPLLGLFKERNDGAGHSYGLVAVRGFEDLTAEPIKLASKGGAQANEVDISDEDMSLNTVSRLFDAFGVDDRAYVDTSFDKRTPEEINGFEMTPGYRAFVEMMEKERAKRPAALRDVLAFPLDLSDCGDAEAVRGK
ncbi:MAG: glutamate synthase central domain-containing protein, partial [Alphaproteobacteria bacterium]